MVFVRCIVAGRQQQQKIQKSGTKGIDKERRSGFRQLLPKLTPSVKSPPEPYKRLCLAWVLHFSHFQVCVANGRASLSDQWTQPSSTSQRTSPRLVCLVVLMLSLPRLSTRLGISPSQIAPPRLGHLHSFL